AISSYFHDGESDVVIVRNVQPIGADPAGNLRAAFDQVAGNRGPGNMIVVVHRPAEMCDTRRDGETWIGHAAGDDNIGAAIERVDDRRGADVSVGGDKRVEHAG